jgi:hypothetical protein
MIWLLQISSESHVTRGGIFIIITIIISEGTMQYGKLEIFCKGTNKSKLHSRINQEDIESGE